MPHSEIHGSKLIRSSPWLIAAYHVLHRLCMPRHPPDALISLDHSHRQCSPFWKTVHADPQCGDRLHGARIAKRSDGRSAYAGHIRRCVCLVPSGRLPSWRGGPLKERGVHGMYSHSTTRRLPCRSSTANARDVQSLSRPAAVLCANPFWRKDWRKTSFLRRSPMPRGQAWQSKQGSPFLEVCCRILSNAPANPRGEGYPCGS